MFYIEQMADEVFDLSLEALNIDSLFEEIHDVELSAAFTKCEIEKLSEISLKDVLSHTMSLEGKLGFFAKLIHNINIIKETMRFKLKNLKGSEVDPTLFNRNNIALSVALSMNIKRYNIPYADIAEEFTVTPVGISVDYPTLLASLNFNVDFSVDFYTNVLPKFSLYVASLLQDPRELTSSVSPVIFTDIIKRDLDGKKKNFVSNFKNKGNKQRLKVVLPTVDSIKETATMLDQVASKFSHKGLNSVKLEVDKIYSNIEHLFKLLNTNEEYAKAVKGKVMSDLVKVIYILADELEFIAGTAVNINSIYTCYQANLELIRNQSETYK